jgi:GAF domain-containing protein
MKIKTHSDAYLAKIFDAYVKSIFELIKLPISIWYPDNKHKKLSIVASAGLPTAYKKRATIALSETSITGDVFRSQKTEIVKDITKEKRWKYKQDAKLLKLKSALCIPIIADNQTKGVLTVYTPNTTSGKHFSTFRSYLESTAAEIGSTIELQNRESALEKILKISEGIISLPISKKYTDILKSIVQDARSILGADLVDLYIYNSDEDTFLLPPIQAGKHKSSSPQKIHKDDVVYFLVHNVKPRYINNSIKENLFTRKFSKGRLNSLTKERFVVREGIVSTAAIPLLVMGRVVGVLFINYKSQQMFSRQQKGLIELFAAQAAIAISTLKLFEKARKPSEAISKFNIFAKNLSKLSAGNTDLNNLLQEIANGAKDVLNADLVDLYQYQQSLDEYPLPITFAGKRNKPTVKSKTPKEDFVSHIVESRRSWYVKNTLREPSLKKPLQRPDKPALRFVEREKILSMAAVPVKADNEIMGVLFVSYRTRQGFSKTQKDLIEQFASQAGSAIRIARFILRRQALVDFGNSIASKVSLSEKEILELIHKQAAGIMDTSNMYIALYDKVTDVVRFGLVYIKGLKVDIAKEPRFHPRQGGHGKTEEIIRMKKHILHTNLKESQEWYAQLGHQDYLPADYLPSTSWVGVPMISGNEVLGVIVTYQDRENVYSLDDLSTLQTIANQAAIVLENARSYEKLNKNLSAVLKFGDAIANSDRLREKNILELIRDQISELMNTKSMYIALYDQTTQFVRFGLVYENGQTVNTEEIEGYRTRKVDMTNRGRTEEIIHTKNYIFISTTKESKDWYKEPGRKEFVGKISPSWLGVPIILGQDVLGVIAVYDPEREYSYTSNHLFILRAIANLAAIGLDNAHQYYDIEQNLRALVEFGQIITSKIDLPKQQILQTIHEKAESFLDASNMYVALCATNNEGRNVIRFDLVYRNGVRENWNERDIESGRTGEIIRTKKPLLLPTKKDIANWFNGHPGEMERVEAAASWLGVAMLVGDKALGVIGVSHPDQEKHYTGEHLGILQALANLAAIAFENARLFEEARGEVQAERQLSTLGRAMAAIEHRINNTLNIVVPNINRLRKRVNVNDEEVKEILEIIERNTRYTSSLIDRIRTASLDINFVEVDINSVLTDVFNKQREEWVSDSTHSMQVESQLEIDPAIPYVRLPVGQVSEVLMNLIQNAYKQLEKAHLRLLVEDNETAEKFIAKLFVTSSMESGKIKIRVQDNVPGGIPQKIQQRLFNKPVPSQIPGEGSGLGLWLSKLIMDSVSGKIEVEKTGSAGTTMLVEIPLSKDEEAE